MAIEQEGQPSEDALFDSAIEDLGPATPAPAEKAPAERPATEAADTSLTPEAKERPAVDDDAPQVPSWRVREINEEKRAAIAERDALKAERDRAANELQEFRRWKAQADRAAQPQPEEPDPLLDPKGFRDLIRQEAREQALAERGEFFMQMAKRTYKEEFDEAHATAMQHMTPELRSHMRRSADPGEALMHWFRDLKIRAEVGNDLTAYRQKMRDEALKDPEFRKAALATWQSEASPTDASGRPNVRLAPSLNGVSRSNAQLRADMQADMPDEALFDSTLARRR